MSPDTRAYRWRYSHEIERVITRLRAARKSRSDNKAPILITPSLADALEEVCRQAKHTEDGHMEDTER
jgi:hypothetical protein